MSYIDNKYGLIRDIQILELENELLRTQIKKLQNDVLDRTKQKDEQDIKKRPKTRSTNN
jgi:hypothetical protein